MDRRGFFRTAGGGVVAICSICASLARATAEGAHWTYSGAQGPDHWGELAPEAQVCAAGSEQSPIDLTGAVPADLPKIEVSYKPQPLRVINNGHTIQVNFQPGSEIAIGKDHYTLLQYHFHHPSEHLLAGNPFAMELHLVHRHASGQLAVLGAFIKPGKANPIIEAVWKAAPKEEGPEQLVGVNWDPSGLLPPERRYFTYAGSLTTPPCSEVVRWVVFAAPIEISADQLKAFAALYPMNARPVRPLGRRFLLASHSSKRG
jgi:carbonic anhydrase